MDGNNNDSSKDLDEGSHNDEATIKSFSEICSSNSSNMESTSKINILYRFYYFNNFKSI